MWRPFVVLCMQTKFRKNSLLHLSYHYTMQERWRRLFFPKLCVHIKDNNKLEIVPTHPHDPCIGDLVIKYYKSNKNPKGNRTPDVPFKWKPMVATDRRKVDLFPWWGCRFRPKFVVHDFNPLLVAIAGPRSPFPVNGTQVCKENTTAERNVPDLSFVYHLLKSWTDRVTHLRSLQNTSGSLLTTKATPQATGNIIIIEFGASNHIYWWQYKI